MGWKAEHTPVQSRDLASTAAGCPYGVKCLLGVKMAGFKSRAGNIELRAVCCLETEQDIEQRAIREIQNMLFSGYNWLLL